MRAACAGALLALLAAPGLPAADPPPLHGDAVAAGPSVEERLAEIQRRVQRALEYPPFARAQGEMGSALVEFHIAQDGQPQELRVLRSSGNALLDRAAERAVRDAAPLPWVFGRIVVPVEFRLDERR